MGLLESSHWSWSDSKQVVSLLVDLYHAESQTTSKIYLEKLEGIFLFRLR